MHSFADVQEYISTVSDRFEFVYTPKHASWLNLVEGFFSKMIKQMLRDIEVGTKDELVTRIYKYFDQINETPVVYHWTWNLADIDTSEIVVTEKCCTRNMQGISIDDENLVRRGQSRENTEKKIMYTLWRRDK